MKFREEVLNVKIAEILSTYGLKANPEIIASEKLPDVRIVIGGLKVILEGKIETHRKALEEQAKGRLENGLADISCAISYSKGLNEAEDVDALKAKMSKALYSGVVYYWGGAGISQIRFDGKSVTELAEMLNHVFALYAKNDLLATKIKEIENGITRITGEGPQPSLFFYFNTLGAKLRQALGIGEEEDGEEEEE